MREVDEQEMLEFITALSLLNPIEFLGVATLLHVPCYKDEEWKEAREAEDLLGEIIDAYLVIGHTKRKKILKQMKKAARDPK